jgi:glycosyltransferase involved in cell wall biosynthesis
VADVLHVLPHRGGGAETYIDLLEAIPGHRHARIALSRGRTASAGIASIARYPPLVRAARRSDLVHLHGDMATVLALPLLAIARRPAVWTTHGLHFLRRAEGRTLAGFEHALRRAMATTACTICTSEAERAELLALARGAPVTAAGLRVVRNGIELPAAADAAARTAARAELRLRGDELAVLFLGELEPRKRPLDAVAAVECARSGGAAVVLLVAGDGPQSDAVRARAGDGVRVLGRRDDVAALLAAADVLVMPSEREGLSFAVLEAMGAGLALVVSDGPGNPEAVGDAGIVIAVGDVPGLAGVLARLAGSRDDVRRLGAAARERVATTLTADALRSGVQAAYAAALAGGGTGRR